MSKLKYIWVAEIEEIFNGYGIIATGRTKKEAEDALWEIYKTRSPGWNNMKTHHHKTLKELEEEWGVRVSKYEIGKGYFSKDGERE
ncbi:MAG: hypothetical protein CMM02_18225 [Rhodopirellula sp.]|nr:hypothetical protein [Rhodopirellula sp.]|tara:strand:- start:1140 stop:1397 length:258 start_codon:yes stop_codon:yes gene_type:complete